MKLVVESVDDFYSLDGVMQAKLLQFMAVMFIMNTAVEQQVEGEVEKLPTYQKFLKEDVAEVESRIEVSDKALPGILAIAMDKLLTGKL